MEVIKWTIYIVFAAFAIFIWAIITQKKKEKNRS